RALRQDAVAGEEVSQAPGIPSPRSSVGRALGRPSDGGLWEEGQGEGRLRLDARAVLVLGGARSGKSRYALGLAEAAAPQRVMIATAQALDDEMAARIARHQAERDASWSTREAPLDLLAALREEARPGRAVLVDCLTLWL